ncbi:MAG: cyclase family protein [Rhizobiaceae bacterium]|nr:cyclase family protein [Rhizobiaceae bacterium]
MCHHCVIQSTKQKMLNRRALLQAGLAGAVSVSIAAPTSGFAQQSAPSLKDRTGQIIDLTHALSPEFPTFGGEPGIAYDQQFNIDDHGYNLYQLRIDEHTATHIDAPLHFSKDGKSVDEIEPSDLVAPLVNIDIREKAALNTDTQLTPDDIKTWMSKYGPLPENCCVAMNSGWSSKVENPTDFTGRDDNQVMHFPGFHIDATQMLLEESSAVAIAVDTLSLDHGPSQNFATHYAWLPAGRYGIENLANLNAVPPNGATIIVGAPKTKGGTGGPARIFAAV